MNIVKRNGDIVAFDGEKIAKAASKALKVASTDDKARLVLANVTKQLSGYETTVDDVHRLVENALMQIGEYDAAREYIEYRSSREPDIFRERKELRPAEYPALLEYKDAVRAAYWTHKEYDYSQDRQSFETKLTKAEQNAVTRCLLAISQTEVAVKAFWGDIGKTMPKPEISEVGATFAENEVRHSDAYRFLITLLGLEGEFSGLRSNPAIKARLDYLDRTKQAGGSKQDFLRRLIMYTMSVENVSLFSQFYVIQTLNAKKDVLEGTANAVKATAQEETLHSNFGFDLVDIIKQEHPELWTQDLIDDIRDTIMQAADAEHEIVDWIFAEGDSDVLTASHVKAYVNERVNQSLTKLGMEKMFDIDPADREAFEWFEVLVSTNSNIDFFAERSVAYSKNTNPVTASDLF